MTNDAAGSASASDGPNLEVADKVVAAIAAHAAATTPGVARLQPYVLSAARSAATTAAKRAGAKLTGRDDITTSRPGTNTSADPDAVDVEHLDGGSVAVTVRVIVATSPPIRHTVGTVAENIATQLHDLAGVNAVVTVNVVDLDVQP